MKREERTDHNWVRIFVLLAILWTVAALPSWGQEAVRVISWPSERHLERLTLDPGGLRPLSELLRASRPHPSLAELLSNLPGPKGLAPGSPRPFSSRTSFGLTAQAEGFIRVLHVPAGSLRGLLGVTRSALHLIDAPGRTLSHITGADSAAFNPLKKRVSFTWFVDLP
jgi:hypothetical protein